MVGGGVRRVDLGGDEKPLAGALVLFDSALRRYSVRGDSVSADGRTEDMMPA